MISRSDSNRSQSYSKVDSTIYHESAGYGLPLTNHYSSTPKSRYSLSYTGTYPKSTYSSYGSRISQSSGCDDSDNDSETPPVTNRKRDGLEDRLDHLISSYSISKSMINPRSSGHVDLLECDQDDVEPSSETEETCEDETHHPAMTKDALRDQKLKEMIKKNKSLLIALEKEKALNGALNRHVKKIEANLLEQQYKLAQEESGIASSELAEETRTLRDKLAFVTRKLEEEKIQSQTVKRDFQIAMKILKQELGPVNNLSDLLKSEGKGWKGRAQQISLLKDRIRELEAKVPFQASTVSMTHLQAATSTTRRDPQLDALMNENKEQKEEISQLKQKNTGAKARIKNLEQTVAEMRKKVEVLLEKTALDDQMISRLMNSQKSQSSK